MTEELKWLSYFGHRTVVGHLFGYNRIIQLSA